MAVGTTSGSGKLCPTIVIADASKMDCQLLVDAIRRHKHFRVVGSATTREELKSAVRTLQPDIAVISARLQDGASAGMQVLPELCALHSPPRVIVLLDEDRPELVVESFRKGARAIFCRTGAMSQLRKCIRSVSKGEIWAANAQVEHVVKAVMQAPAPKLVKAQALSKRETEVVRLIASGLSNREVAQRLSLSHHTIKNYLFRVFEKLGISTRIELVLYILSQYKGPESEQNHVTGMRLEKGA